MVRGLIALSSDFTCETVRRLRAATISSVTP